MKTRQLARHGATLLATAGVVMLAGCSSAFNPIGSNTYDCNRKQDPSSIYCHSFKAVESSTNEELPDSRFDAELKFSQYDKATEIAPVKSSSGSAMKGGAGESVSVGRGVIQAQLGGADVATADDTPVREGPVVQRTWIKHFVDSNDARVGDTVVYKEIVPTHWAGFDGGDPQSVEHNLYPHKPTDTKIASTAARAAPAPSQQSDFIQPGTGSAMSESPSSSQAMSMPQ